MAGHLLSTVEPARLWAIRYDEPKNISFRAICSMQLAGSSIDWNEAIGYIGELVLTDCPIGTLPVLWKASLVNIKTLRTKAKSTGRPAVFCIDQ